MQDIKAARFIFAFPTLPAIIHTKKVPHIYDAKNSQNVTKKVIFFLGMLCHFHYLIVHKHRKAWFNNPLTPFSKGEYGFALYVKLYHDML